MAIPLNVQRVVSLAPNLTETIYALGLDAKLAGDTTYCDIPPAAKEKPHVGAPQDPSLEAIVALHPDLVLATTSINRAETADALLKIGVPVYTSDPAHHHRDAGRDGDDGGFAGRERAGRDACSCNCRSAWTRCTRRCKTGPWRTCCS